MVNNRNIIACIMGNIIEWYEFSLFAYLAPVIAALFFPKENHMLGLLLTFLVFALGFVVRPLSALILGCIGDKVGRAKTLKLTIFFLSCSSILTGLLPTYQSVGILAPLLLVVCRLLQGFCIGGEFAGAMIYLSESANPKHRALVSCMANNGSNIGILLAVSVCALVSGLLGHDAFVAYGWRLLFIFGGLLGVLGLWLRKDITESAVFMEIQRKILNNYPPISYVFKHQRKKMLKIILLLVISACGSYTLMNYLSTYLHVFLNVPLAQSYRALTIFIVVTLFFVPLFAVLSDKFGRRKVLLFSTVGYLLFAIPVFTWLQHMPTWWMLIPLIIFYSAEQAVTPVAMVEMFPSQGRYTGISFAYNITMALVGGTAPFVNTYLIKHFQNPLMIAYYIMVCAVISLAVVLFGMPAHHGKQRSLLDVDT